MHICADGFTIANELKGIESVMAAFYFMDMADRAIQQLAKLLHG